MNPNWAEVVTAVATGVIAVAAIVLGLTEIVRAKNQNAFARDLIMREWRRHAAHLTFSAKSTNSSEIRITNRSSIAFRRIAVRVHRIQSIYDDSPALKSYQYGKEIACIMPGDEVVLDFSGPGYTGEELKPLDASWFVQFSDHDDRRWHYQSSGHLFLIDEVESGRLGYTQVVNTVELLEEHAFASPREMKEMREGFRRMVDEQSNPEDQK